MRKLIAAINTTIDGFCNHEYGIADDELHNHYAELIQNAGTLLYGRITYQLMEYWPTVLKNPTGNKAEYDFAVAIDKVEKVIFSNTLKSLDWKTARLATKDLKEEVLALKQQSGKDIFAGSPSLILQLTNLNLVDEYQICVHPVIAGEGLPLFKRLTEKKILKLLDTKTFGSGATVLYYKSK